MAAIYKFRLTFEELEDFYRDIEIKSNQTFLEFHQIILQSLDFKEGQMASFYMSNDNWKKLQEITLENMTEDEENPIPEMATSKLASYVNDPHQKILYVYDFIELWTIQCEMTGIVLKEKAGESYPRITKKLGIAPKQFAKTQKFGAANENEFDELTKNFSNEPDALSDEEADEFGLFSKAEDEEGESDEFGFSGASDEDSY